jgi:hypothetical protein
VSRLVCVHGYRCGCACVMLWVCAWVVLVRIYVWMCLCVYVRVCLCVPMRVLACELLCVCIGVCEHANGSLCLLVSVWMCACDAFNR